MDLSLDLLMYVILAVVVIWVWRVESIDVKCPDFDSDEARCKNEGGMSFSGTRPADTDSCQDLLAKLRKGAGAEQASIKWRRALVLSSVSMVVMWVLVGTPGTLPDWKTLYLSILIGYLVLFSSFNYYSYHVYGTAERWMKDAIRELEQKSCIRS